MLPKLAVLALVAIARLQAQPSAAQLNKLYSQMDDAMGVRSGALICDIGTGFAIDHALRKRKELHQPERSFAWT